MKKKAGFKKYIKPVGNVVSALSILFILTALLRMDFDAVSVKNVPLFLLVCTAGTAIKTATVFLSAGAWRRWLEFFSGKRCDRKEARNVYAKANIGKYMPGNVMHYVERNLFAGKLELSQKQIAAASLLEVLCLAAAAFFIGAVLAFSGLRQALAGIYKEYTFLFNLQADGQFLQAVFQTAIICAAAAIIAGVWYYSRRAKGFAGTFFRCFLTYAAVLVLLGAILVLLEWYWSKELAFAKAALLVSAYVIAWVLGFVIPGAPGGIGVRELVLTILLLPALGRDMVAVLSVVHRLITVLGDFAAYFLRLFLRGR